MAKPHMFDGPMVVFDLETLAVSHRARVYEVGALRVEFDPDEAAMRVLQSGHWRLHGRDQARREVDPSTVAWMAQTPGREAALAEAEAGGMAVAEFRNQFAAFFRDGAIGWCRGTHFDMAILENLFADHGLEPPWRYDGVMDLRTLGRLRHYMGIDLEVGEMPHDALADCKCELPGMAVVLARLRALRS